MLNAKPSTVQEIMLDVSKKVERIILLGLFEGTKTSRSRRWGGCFKQFGKNSPKCSPEIHKSKVLKVLSFPKIEYFTHSDSSKQMNESLFSIFWWNFRAFNSGIRYKFYFLQFLGSLQKYLRYSSGYNMITDQKLLWMASFSKMH